MREKNRKPIASRLKLPQFTTMNVIDGQAGFICYASLIFYSLTIDNILNIIVLLILAGISIVMLTGEGGILQNAREAKDKTGRANVIEMAQLDVLETKSNNQGKIKEDEFKDILGRYFTINDEKENILESTLTTKDGKYNDIKASEIYSGEFSGSTPTVSKKVEDLKNAKQLVETNTEVTSDDDVKVTVPAGFTIPNESPNEAIDGIIITDSIDDEGKSNGNEFVWIPITEDLKVVGTEKFMAKETSSNYGGVLYEFSGTNSSVKSSTDYREPDTVSAYDGDEPYLNIIKGILTGEEYSEKYDSITIFKTTMQEDYNEMIDSVKTYGGFYVGRYEMGLENRKAISKKGPATDAFQGVTSYKWYGLYAYGKTYENTKKTTKSSVKSSMIWGSQYDAMLNYALLGEDKAKVTATGNGYHSGSTAIDTGETTDDKILNIFDLEGNHDEWTLEAFNTNCRVDRGGNYYYSGSPSFRGYFMSSVSSDSNSSRLTLYIQ